MSDSASSSTDAESESCSKAVSSTPMESEPSGELGQCQQEVHSSAGSSESGEGKDETAKLPAELLERLLCYVEGSELLRSCQLVCRRWRSVLGSETFWKRRIRRRHPSLRFAAATEASEDFRWDRSAAALEREEGRWAGKSGDAAPQPALLQGVHFSTIDAVRLFGGGRFLLSGARDRSLALWDLDAHANVAVKPSAHAGWIWSLHSASPDTFYSAGFDSHVRGWAIREGGEMEVVGDAKGRAAFLCLSQGPEGLLLASSYDRKVAALDPRAGLAQVAQLQHHTGPVFALASSAPYLWSCSEDKTVRLVDARTWAPVGEPARLRSVPLAMALCQCQLWVSDSHGALHSFDASGRVPPAEGKARAIRVADRPKDDAPAGRSPNKIRDVVANRGSVMVATEEKRVRVFRAGRPLRAWADFAHLDAEPSRLDYSPESGRLVAALTNNAVAVWGLTEQT